MSRKTDDNRVLFETVLAVLTVLVIGGLVIQPVAAGVAATAHSTSDAPGIGSPTVNQMTETGNQPELRSSQDDTPQVVLEDNTLTQERGDAVVLNFTFSGGAEEARVTLGSSEDVNFEVEFTIRDGDGDGSVAVLWNTAEADAPDAGLTVKSGSAEAGEDAFSDGPIVVDGLTDPIESAEYPVSIVTVTTDTETDLGVVTIEERSSENLTVHTAPASHTSFESESDVENVASSAAAGENIALDDRAQDWVILRLNASGLSSSIDEIGDLVNDSNHVTITVSEDTESLGMNEEPVRMQPDDNVSLYSNDTDDIYYIVFRPSELLDEGATIGDGFTVNFTVGEGHEFTEKRETLTASFTLVEGRASFDRQDGQLLVEANETARVTGTSTWAPGTNLLVHLRSSDNDGDATPFTAQNGSVVVAPDGTWTATFDLSEQSAGQRVDALVFHADTSAKLADASGELR